MSDVVIKAENLGKKYTIGHQAENGSYLALRDVLAQNARGLWHKTRDLARGKPIIVGDTTEEVWALKDVNFEIRRGEAVGIIGRNGAGKSTLLKVLSRITEPSAGRVTIKGRVASLLEVGTGFHPELTGRENIYLNGAILGMTRAEIKRKFDEIVDFAEVEKFLDTPVKRYSSGMYVRLAFAVAAHLEPEILVVDEVLAVGDAAFQKKCLGKMGEVANEGRTVLFVSHNMAAVQNLCTRAITLQNGRMTYSGKASEVIQNYLSSLSKGKDVFQDDGIMKEMSILNDLNEPTLSFSTGEGITFIAHLSPPHRLSKPTFGYGVLNLFGERITTLHTAFQMVENWELETETSISVHWQKCQLCPGSYKVMAALYDGLEKIMVWDEIATLHIIASDYFGTGRMPETGSQGWYLSDAEWQILPSSNGWMKEGIDK